MTEVPGPVRTLVMRWIDDGQPHQGGFSWPRARWIQAFPRHEDFLGGLPERLDRGHLRGACREAANGLVEAERAFLAVMAWGYGSVGYGPWRIRRALTETPDATRALHQAARCVGTEGGLAGYKILAITCRIRYLGPAFGTKYLHFLPQPSEREPALILDRLVAGWLRSKTGLILNPGPWGPTNYRRYVEAMTAWAAELHVAPEAIEERVFVAARNTTRRRSELPRPQPLGEVERTGRSIASDIGRPTGF